MIEVVDLVYQQNKSVLDYLEEQREISFRADVDDKFKKIILLSAASYFEQRITTAIMLFANACTNENGLLTAFVKNKAISRQFHTFFDWESKNVNKFLGLFGDGFKEDISKDFSNAELLEGSKAFLELGLYRNRLVHQNFAEFYLDKTSEEIYELYKKAVRFIDHVELKLMNSTVKETSN